MRALLRHACVRYGGRASRRRGTRSRARTREAPRSGDEGSEPAAGLCRRVDDHVLRRRHRMLVGILRGIRRGAARATARRRRVDHAVRLLHRGRADGVRTARRPAHERPARLPLGGLGPLRGREHRADADAAAEVRRRGGAHPAHLRRGADRRTGRHRRPADLAEHDTGERRPVRAAVLDRRLLGRRRPALRVPRRLRRQAHPAGPLRRPRRLAPRVEGKLPAVRS